MSNERGRSAYPRSAPRDIAALARSGHVEVGGALPISQRVQTSGRGDPPAPRWSAEGERAQRILGRGYAEGGVARRYALALWLAYAYPGGTDALAVALGVLHSAEISRHVAVREWSRWGVGGSADTLVAEAVELLGRAIGWYLVASEEPGCAGHLGVLVSQADGVRDASGVVGRLREWWQRWVSTRVDCHAIQRKTRCEGEGEPRGDERGQAQPTCFAQAFPWSDLERLRHDRCGSHEDDCALEWPAVCDHLPVPKAKRSKSRAA